MRARKGAEHWVCLLIFRGSLFEQIDSRIVVFLQVQNQAKSAGVMEGRAVGLDMILAGIFRHLVSLPLGFYNKGGNNDLQ